MPTLPGDRASPMAAASLGTGMQLPSDASSSTTTVAAADAASPAALVVAALVKRLVAALPVSTGAPLATLESDPRVRAAVSVLVSQASAPTNNNAPRLVRALLPHIERLAALVTAARDDNPRVRDALASALFLARVLVSILFAHWRSFASYPTPESRNPWPDPPALDDALAQQALAALLACVRIAVHRSESGAANAATTTSGTTSQTASSSTTETSSNSNDDHDPISPPFVLSPDGTPDADLLSLGWGPLSSLPPAFPASLLPFLNPPVDFHSAPGDPPELNPYWLRPGLYARTSLPALSPEMPGPFHTATGQNSAIDIKALATALGTHAAMAILYLSSSNWNVVRTRLRSRLATLSAAAEGEAAGAAADLRLLTCLNLDRTRLEHVLADVGDALAPSTLSSSSSSSQLSDHASPSGGNSRRQLTLAPSQQRALALALRRGITSWIAYRPSELSMLYRIPQEGQGQTLLDSLLTWSDLKRNPALWSLVTTLLVLCPERVAQMATLAATAGQYDGSRKLGLGRRDTHQHHPFIELLRRTLRSRSATLNEVNAAAHAATDLLTGAAALPQDTTETSPLRAIARVFIPDLKERVLTPFLHADTAESDMLPDDTVGLASELLRATFLLDPNQSPQTPPEAWVQCLAPQASLYAKLAATKALMTLLTPMGRPVLVRDQPVTALLWPLLHMIPTALRATFKTTLVALLRNSPGANGTGSTPISLLAPASSPPPATQADRSQWPPSSSRISNSSKRPFSRGPTIDARLRTDDNAMRIELLRTILLVWCEDASLWAQGLSDEPGPLPPRPTSNGEVLSGSKAALTSEGPAAHARAAVGLSAASIYAERLLHASSPAEAKAALVVLWCFVRCANKLAEYSVPNDTNGDQAIMALLSAEKSSDRSTLDAALLMALCQPDPDVCQDAMAVGQAWGVHDVDGLSLGRSPHWPQMYDSLIASSTVYVGRVAQQRRIRTALRSIRVADHAARRALHQAYRRWTTLTRIVARPEADATDERVTYWHNLAGLLASLGGACGLPSSTEDRDILAQQQQQIDAFLHSAVELLNSESLWVREKIKETLGTDLSPRLCAPLVTQIHTAIALIFTASTDGAPALTSAHTRLVEQSVAVLLNLASRLATESISASTTPSIMAGPNPASDRTFSPLVAPSVPNAPSGMDQVDLGPLLVLYAEYASALPTDDRAIRIRTGLASLTRTVLAHPALLLLSHASRVKNRLLHALVAWSTDDQSDPLASPSVSAGTVRLSRELVRIALPAAADLAHGLVLRADDAAYLLGDSPQAAVIRVFAQLLRALMPLARRACLASDTGAPTTANGTSTDKGERAADRPLAEAAIACLSRIGAVNPDAALTLLVPLTYDADLATRAAAIQVVAGILSSNGGDFGSSPEDKGSIPENSVAATHATRAQLVDLLSDGGMQLALAMCQVPRIPEVEPVDRMLLSVLAARSRAVPFLCIALREEVDATSSEEMVLRSNSFRTRVLSLYARMHGYTYLRSVLAPLLIDVENLTRSAGPDACEIDPTRLAAPGPMGMGINGVLSGDNTRQLATNQARLESLAQSFIDAICSSASRIPADLRALAAQIRGLMLSRFPHAVHQGVGGFIFLRFISPMIVAPQLVDLHLDPALESGTRRTLLLVSKILQTLASNNLFGGHKEPHMTLLNGFLKRNVWRVTNFLDQVANSPLPSSESTTESKDYVHALAKLGYADTDIAAPDQIAVHKYLWDNSDKLGKELALRSTELRARGLHQLAQQTATLYPKLVAILQNADSPHSEAQEVLGPYLAQPEVTAEAYADLMRRRARTPIPTADQTMLNNILRVGPASRAGRPVVYYTAALVPGEQIDLTALMAHAFNVLQPLSESYSSGLSSSGFVPSGATGATGATGGGFDLFIDLTASGPQNFLSYSTLLYFFLLAPPQARAAVRTVVVLNVPHSLRDAAHLIWPMSKHLGPYHPSNSHQASPSLPTDPLKSFIMQVSIHVCTTLSEVESFISPRNLVLWDVTRTVLYAASSTPSTNASASKSLGSVTSLSSSAAPATTISGGGVRATVVLHTGAHIPVILRAAGAYLCIVGTRVREVLPTVKGICTLIVPPGEQGKARPIGPAVSDPSQTAFLLTFRTMQFTRLLYATDYTAVVDLLSSIRAAGAAGPTIYLQPVPVPTFDLTTLPLVGPGIVLNAALLNLTSDSYHLRMASYALLSALTSAPALAGTPRSRQGTKSAEDDGKIASGKLLDASRLALPSRCSPLASELSRDFAANAPLSVTLSVALAFVEGITMTTSSTSLPCLPATALQYIAPWLSNMPSLLRFPNPQRAAYVKLIKDFFGSLLIQSVERDELFVLTQRWVWTHVNKLDELLPLFLDVALEQAVTLGVHTSAAERIVGSLSAFSSPNIRGKLLARLRIAVTHVGVSLGTATALDSPAGSEVAVLLRMLMVLSFTSRWEAMLFFPETLHVCLLLAGTGPEYLRTTVQGCVLNLVHSICTDDGVARGEKPVNAPPMQLEALRRELDYLCSDEALLLFGLPRGGTRAFDLEGAGDLLAEPLSPLQLASLAERLYTLPELAAPSIDTANAWRARLTSLVTAAAFQFNPYLQTRAFVLLGSLSQGEIDDDLVYQVLVSLRSALAEWAHHGTEDMLVSLLLCLSKLVYHLPPSSPSIPQIFWIAVSMLQVGRLAIFRVAIDLVTASLAVLDSARHGPTMTDAMGLPNSPLQSVPLYAFLLRERRPFRDAACRLDDACGIDFDADFGFALTTLLVKGLREMQAAEQTKELLHTLLRLASEDDDATQATDPVTGQDVRLPRTRVEQSSVAFFVALLAEATADRGLSKMLYSAGLSSVADSLLSSGSTLIDGPTPAVIDVSPFLAEVSNKTALLVVALLAALVEKADGEKEALILYTLLARITERKPAIVSIIYDRLTPGLEHVLEAGRDVRLIGAVERIVGVALREPVFAAQVAETARRGGLAAYLEESGFIGLLTCGTFATASHAISVAASAAASGVPLMAGPEQPTPEQQRIHWAALASDMMADLIDAGQ